VVFLRHYRDQVLQQTRSGRVFVSAYYLVGPLLAAGIELLPSLRLPSRRALDALIVRIKKSHPYLQDSLKDPIDD
jgi:hypothetical protein